MRTALSSSDNLTIPSMKSLWDCGRCLWGTITSIQPTSCIWTVVVEGSMHITENYIKYVFTASLYFPVSGFLQSSENVPSPIQEQPEWQGSLPSRGPPLKYGKEDSVGPWPRVSFFGGRLPRAGGWNPSATVVTTPVAHPLFITLIAVGLSFSPLSLHLYFNPVSWDHLPHKLSASRSLWQKPKLICDTQLSPSYDFLKSSSKVTGNVSGAMAPSHSDLQIAECILASFPWDSKGVHSPKDKTGGFQSEWQIYLLKIDLIFVTLVLSF